ncbi:MAG TPA: PilC/PilY family type IV pilus protein [Steroidobacteraceae bacterium]
MNAKYALLAMLAGSAALMSHEAGAQTNYTENFTGTSTTNQWTFLNGACLTSGTAATTSASSPACVGLTYYANKSDTSFLGGYNGTFPDPTNGGALRFTNKYNENGAILSFFTYPLAAQGLAVSFTTVTYDGDSGGAGGDGADGISFFLQDASYLADVGAFGGSLAYTCSNANNDGTINANTGLARGFDGLQGGYIGLGIDEYGNFLNGTTNTLGETGTSATGDNTASGGGYQPGRIGMRGPGAITWASLTAKYPTYYPSTLTGSNRTASVQDACKTGLVADWSTGSKVALAVATPIAISPPNAASYTSGTAPVYGDYPAIPSAYKVLPTTQPIAAESAGNRGNANPITYNLKITPAGLLSLSYSYNGGANQAVISNVDITEGGANPLPTNIRFGFAGSTGGSRNVHEIMCFQATPSNTSSSSAGLNQKQTAKVQTGSQVYFAYYNPQTLAGSLTSQYLVPDTNNNLTISSVINWDGSCVLTGVPVGQNCDTTGPVGTGSPLSPPGSRTILSWNYVFSSSTGLVTTSQGTPIPFEWSSLNSNEQALLDSGDSTPITQLRLNYLRGDRTQEQVPTSTTTFTGIYRDRVSVLGDIVDSSPTWVGPPNSGYPNSWSDLLDSTGDPFPENSGETYATYATSGSATATQPNEGQRTNVVYAGANDGMLHGFRTGSYNSDGTVNETNNDGTEVLAYIPGYIVNSIQNSTNVARNFSDPQYGHKFDVDAAPSVGDVFYNSRWHTWLVGGLGPGGKAIFALDVSDPDSMFSESNAANVVMGEWSNLSITCTNNSSCGNSLGNTYGTPVIRRLHNGNWAAIFGNGIGSTQGDAGIFIMLISSTGGTSFYYLSTGVGSSTSPNGISYVSAADLDGDRITDYVYAGDIQGNLWRFDLTSTSPGSWAVGANPVFTTPSAQPITTAPVILATPGSGPYPHVMIEFGTGRQVPQNLISAATYQTAQMGIYGVWDWNMSNWNSKSSTKFAVPYGTYPSQPTVPTAFVAGTSKLTVQTISGTTTATSPNTGSDYRTVSANAVCYADVNGCTNYGWYLNLVSGYPDTTDPAVPLTTAAVPGATVLYEQVIFNPVLTLGALVINTTIPPQTSALACYSSGASGWTMAIDPTTGGSFATGFFEDGSTGHNVLNVGTTPVSGLALGGTGSFSTVQYSPGSSITSTSATGSQYYGITQTATSPFIGAINAPGNVKGKRVTWIQKR